MFNLTWPCQVIKRPFKVAAEKLLLGTGIYLVNNISRRLFDTQHFGNSEIDDGLRKPRGERVLFGALAWSGVTLVTLCVRPLLVQVRAHAGQQVPGHRERPDALLHCVMIYF